MFYSTNHRLNRKLRCWITASIFWLSSCHIDGAKSQYRRFISRQKTYNWNSNKNVEVQIQEIQSKTGRYQIGRAIWKPGGTIWSWVQLAPPDYLGWPGTVVPCRCSKIGQAPYICQALSFYIEMLCLTEISKVSHFFSESSIGMDYGLLWPTVKIFNSCTSQPVVCLQLVERRKVALAS